MSTKAIFWSEGLAKLMSAGVKRQLAGKLVKAVGSDYAAAMRIAEATVQASDPVKYLGAAIRNLSPPKLKPATKEPSIESTLIAMGYSPVKVGEDRWSAGDYVYNSKGEIVGG